MDRFLVRKDVYEELEKAMRDRSHLVQKDITDKNGNRRKVWVRGNVLQKEQKTVKGEEPTEETKGKPKFNAGDSVNLDGAKGDFKVQSIDKDGAYHVVSADGKKGYKVSENHITGKTEKNTNTNNEEQTKNSKEEKSVQYEKPNAEHAILSKLSEEDKQEIYKVYDKPDVKESLESDILVDSSKGEKIFKNLNPILQRKIWEMNNDYVRQYVDWSKYNGDLTGEAMYQLYKGFKKNSKKTVDPKVQAFRKEQQKKEKESYERSKQIADFYKNTGLPVSDPSASLHISAVEKEENKQNNLKAGNRDDSIFNENDDVTFWRSGNYIDGKITKIDQDYRGAVSLQVESNGHKYWVETDDIIKHPASDSNKEKDKGNNKPVPENDVAARDMPSGYVSQLSEETKGMLLNELKKHFKDSGMSGEEMADAVDNAMDSKVSDLQDLWNENQEIKTILWNEKNR